MITPKSKSNSPILKEEIVRLVFICLLENAREAIRLREIKMKIQCKLRWRKLQRCFTAWRMFTLNSVELNENKEKIVKKEKKPMLCDSKKIEIFIAALKEKKAELAALEEIKEVQNKPEATEKEVKSSSRPASKLSAKNRIETQRKLIEKQRIKLAEQSRLIEEMRMMKIQKDFCLKVNKSDDQEKPSKSSNPPKFLLAVEARAEARKQRMRRVDEDRQKRVKEELGKNKVERKKIGFEERQKLQLEVTIFNF